MIINYLQMKTPSFAHFEYFIRIHKVINAEKLNYTFCTEDVENENDIIFFELNNN